MLFAIGRQSEQHPGHLQGTLHLLSDASAIFCQCKTNWVFGYITFTKDIAFTVTANVMQDGLGTSYLERIVI